MRSWKVVLGLGAACAACCAVPLLGVAGGMAAVGGGLAAFGAALAACADELLPAAVILLGAAGLGLAWWRRRREAARQAACECTTVCTAGTANSCGS